MQFILFDVSCCVSTLRLPNRKSYRESCSRFSEIVLVEASSKLFQDRQRLPAANTHYEIYRFFLPSGAYVRVQVNMSRMSFWASTLRSRGGRRDKSKGSVTNRMFNGKIPTCTITNTILFLRRIESPK